MHQLETRWPQARKVFFGWLCRLLNGCVQKKPKVFGCVCVCGYALTLSTGVPQHGVRHHHYGSAQHVGQNKHMELFQTLIHWFL